jgi:hypothetical protein
MSLNTDHQEVITRSHKNPDRPQKRHRPEASAWSIEPDPIGHSITDENVLIKGPSRMSRRGAHPLECQWPPAYRGAIPVVQKASIEDEYLESIDTRTLPAMSPSDE